MNRDEIQSFCQRWLEAWEENKPEGLIQFYADDALYIDPANKDGLEGRDRIFSYFTKLLAMNPNWKWERVQLFPTDLGFIVKWKASIPVGGKTIAEYGMDIVDIAQGKIARNEVYFDRSCVLEALREMKVSGENQSSPFSSTIRHRTGA